MMDPDRAIFESLATKVLLTLSRGRETHSHLRRRLIETLGKNSSRGEKAGADIIDFCMKWAGIGMPHIMPSHKLTASMMATSIPQELAGDVIVPWGAFLITCGSGIMQDGELSIAVNSFGDMVRVMCFDRRGDEKNNGMFWNICESWPKFASGDFDKSDPEQIGAFYYQQEKIGIGRRRWIQLVMRLVFGVCAEIGTTANHKTGFGGTSEQKQTRSDPQNWTIQLTRPVKVDCRGYVKAFLDGSRGTLKTQHYRRGHWRNQPHGKGGQLRKFIHIEPTWVGEDDSPIAVRPHVIGCAQ